MMDTFVKNNGNTKIIKSNQKNKENLKFLRSTISHYYKR